MTPHQIQTLYDLRDACTVAIETGDLSSVHAQYRRLVRAQILAKARPPKTGQERALYQAMHEESEAKWFAGWYSGCERIFWSKGLFRDLAQAAGGWIVWVDDQDLPGLLFGDWGPRVVPLKEWEILFADCPYCGGTGAVDSGGFTPEGAPVSVPCSFCAKP